MNGKLLSVENTNLFCRDEDPYLNGSEMQGQSRRGDQVRCAMSRHAHDAARFVNRVHFRMAVS